MRKRNLFLTFVLMLMFVPTLVGAESELRYKEVLKTDFDGTDLSGFALNTIKLDDGYVSAISLIGKSKASEIVKYNADGVVWQTDSFKSSNSDVFETSNGNILMTIEEGVLVFDSKGNKIKEVEFENTLGFPGGRSVFAFGDNYAIVGLRNKYGTDATSYIVITIVDEDGNVLDWKEFELKADTSSGSTVVGSYFGACGDGENLYLLVNQEGNISVVIFDQDLEYEEKVLDVSDVSEEGISKIKTGAFSTFALDGNDLYFSTQYGIFKVTDYKKLEEKVVASESSISGLDFTSLVIKDDYFIAGGLSTGDDNNTIATLVIYDKDFNVVEQISVNDSFSNTDETGLNLVKGLTLDGDNLIVGGMFNESPFVIVYQFYYNITVKTDGNGVVTASHVTSESGGVVEFVVEPMEGYALKRVIVTTSEGEVIEFSDYKFTMPSADVEIYAEFEKVVNPNTGINSPFVICGIVAFVGGFGIYLIKKKKYI